MEEYFLYAENSVINTLVVIIILVVIVVVVFDLDLLDIVIIDIFIVIVVDVFDVLDILTPDFIVKLLILCESICRRQIDFTASQATFCGRQRRPSYFFPQAAQAKRPPSPPPI